MINTSFYIRYSAISLYLERKNKQKTIKEKKEMVWE
jgi:hypothetical protein